MQLRCSYCQTMFAIGHEETLAAIEHMADNNLKYYDAHCPNCRRANRVERFKMEASYPGWQAALKAMVKEADQTDAKQAVAATTAAKAPAAGSKTPPLKKVPAPAAKAVPARATKPAVKKATTVKKSSTSKPKDAVSPKKPTAKASTSKAKKK
jgi:hypothetical protein